MSRGYRRSRSIVSDAMRAIGSLTHWTIRYLLIFLLGKIGIEIGDEVAMVIAYILTGVLLVWLGVWSSLWWWPFF